MKRGRVAVQRCLWRLLRRQSVAVFVAAGVLTALSAPKKVRACGACETPELLGFEQTTDGTVVAVSNFGLLTLRDGKWQLTCEEVIGGLLLTTDTDATGRFVSTTGGLFRSSEDVCDWQPAQQGSSSEWFADFAIATTADGADPQRFAVSTHAAAGEVRVERARADSPFEVVHTLALERGYQLLSAAGEPTAVFVCGYSFGPATWHIAFSLDGGESWTEHSEAAADANELFVPLGLDPRHPTRLLLALETRADRPDEIWSFDAETTRLMQVVVLGEREAVHGIAWQDDEVLISAKARGAATSVLYAAPRGSLEFERLREATPPRDCLHAEGDTLLGCVNDFSLESEQLLTRSRDRGQSWEPILRLEDLLQVESCSGCEVTEAWLRDGYGLPPAPPAAGASDAGLRTADPGAGEDASAGSDEGLADAGGGARSSALGGGCSVMAVADVRGFLGFSLTGLFLGFLTRRRRTRTSPLEPTSQA